MNFISKYHVGTRWRLRLINSLLNFNPKEIVLDAGCGDGFISYKMSRKVNKVVGVDISKKLIDENKKFSDNKISFECIDLNNLSKKINQEFDKMICMDVLEHAHGFINIINNFSKVLKKNGTFLATIPVFEGHGHFKHNDFGYLKEVFKKEGFKLEKLEYIQMPFFTKLIDKFIKLLRKLSGYEMKEVDSFDKTLSFELRRKENWVFKIYNVFFSVLFLLTYFDIKAYNKGKDFILIKSHKS